MNRGRLEVECGCRSPGAFAALPYLLSAPRSSPLATPYPPFHRVPLGKVPYQEIGSNQIPISVFLYKKPNPAPFSAEYCILNETN